MFDQNFESMVFAAFKILSDEHKSKDIAQEVLLDIWKKRENLNIHSSIKAFLKKATVFKTIDHLRKEKLKFEEVPEDNSIFKIESTKELEYSELKSFLQLAIDGLPERCRIIFILSRQEQLSHKEIAIKLGISAKTIENQITKALKVLRITLHKYNSPIIFYIFYWFSMGGTITF